MAAMTMMAVGAMKVVVAIMSDWAGNTGKLEIHLTASQNCPGSGAGVRGAKIYPPFAASSLIT